MTETFYAIIRIRGSSETDKDVEDTMLMLNLTRVNHCVVRKKTSSLDGMLRKASGNLTWGEIIKEMLEKLVEKKGRLPGEKRIDAKAAKEEVRKILSGEKCSIKNVFRLHPPSGGYRAIKMPFPEGDLGYRSDKINKLVGKMV